MDKIFRDKSGKVVLGQVPNKPLYIWIAATILHHIVNSNPGHNLLVFIAAVSLAYWAILEIRYGVNYFRRIIGTFILVLVLMNLAMLLLPKLG